MSLITDAEWTLRQLRIEFIRSEDQMAERIINFAAGFSRLIAHVSHDRRRESSAVLLECPTANIGMATGSQVSTLMDSKSQIPLNYMVERDHLSVDSVLPGTPSTTSYLVEPVPEQVLCYSPNIIHLATDVTVKKNSGNSLKLKPNGLIGPASSEPVLNLRQIKAVPAIPSNILPPPPPARKEIAEGFASGTKTKLCAGKTELFIKINPVKKKEEVSPSDSGASVLTNKIRGALSSGANIFAKDYSFVGGKGEPNPIRLKIYFPFSAEPQRPILVSIKRDATVEEAIGYSLFQYVEEKMQPLLDSIVSINRISAWNMRICEDDGAIDEDFPALERARKIQKFSFDQFAICQASSSQVKANEQTLPRNASELKPASNVKKPARNLLIDIHLYSTLEVQQTTKFNLPSDMILSDVLAFCCKKRKFNPADYTLKMADTKTDVPFDKTLESLGVKELCLARKERGPSAGDIFVRPPDERNSHQIEPDQIEATQDEYTSAYKKFVVSRKTNMMGKQERILAVDGDYIYILPSEQRNIFDSVKTVSFHASAVISCVQIKDSPTFKLTFKKDRDLKTFEFDAGSDLEAGNFSNSPSYAAN